MTYHGALYLQTLACRGMSAHLRLGWAQARLPGVPTLTAADINRLSDQELEGRVAARLLWEAGIRFSYSRVLREGDMPA